MMRRRRGGGEGGGVKSNPGGSEGKVNELIWRNQEQDYSEIDQKTFHHGNLKPSACLF